MLSRSSCLVNRLNVLGSVQNVGSVSRHLTNILLKSNFHSTVAPSSWAPTLSQSRQLASRKGLRSLESSIRVLNSTRLFHKAPEKPPTEATEGEPKKANLGSALKPPAGSILGEDLKNIMESQVIKEDDSAKKSDSTPGAAGETPNDNKPKSGFERIFSKEHAWKYSLSFLTVMLGGSILYLIVDWGAPSLDENKNPIRDDFSNMPIFIQYPRRAFHAATNYYEMMKEPSTEKLLPEPIQPPYYQPPYTLVIEMTGILLHPEWTFSHGWRYKKRPGLDYFIEQVKYPLFEVVLFTREPFLAGAPIVSSLDPQNQIAFKLFRESTKFVDNKYVKDLSFMNRDLSKIIVIDWDKNAYSLQPRNALHRLKKWEGDETDTDLVYLATFLKLLAASGVSDVREVLDYYNKEIDPLDTFKLNQVKLHEAEEQRKQELEALKDKQKKSFSLFRR